MNFVLIEKKGAVGVITLNRPEKFNALNREMAFALQHRLDQCAGDADIRSIYLTGNGKAFCAGQDLNELVTEDAPGFDKILAEHYNPIVSRIRHIAKPIVCAVNGVAAGAGANIALCCDIVVATESASFVQVFSKIGLIPDSGGTYVLPRLIGWQRASALMMLGERVSAAQAEKMGMIYKSFSDQDFPEQSMTIASTLSTIAPKGLALTKEALNHSFENTLVQQLSLEDKLQNAAARSKDYREGVNAFLEKRMPIFKGE